VYILTTKKNTVLYIGVTSDLLKRCHQHKEKEFQGFTKRYNVDKLIYFELYGFIQEAIKREKQIKGYSRAKKVALIEKLNPTWEELFVDGCIKKLPA
jgi:putative endonuclease